RHHRREPARPPVRLGRRLLGDFHLPTGAKDAILWQANGGNGIGRYINNEGTNQGDFVVDPSGTPHLIDVWDATLGLIHYWTDQLRTNVDGEVTLLCHSARRQHLRERGGRVALRQLEPGDLWRPRQLDLEPDPGGGHRCRVYFPSARQRRRPSRHRSPR